MVNFDFITLEPHRRIVGEVLSHGAQDQIVVGVLLEGSLARDDANPGSDIDFRMLLKDGHKRSFHTETRNGLRLEIHYADLSQAQARLKEHPMDVYAYLDGRILYDPAGRLAQLIELAKEQFDSYRLPHGERERLSYWLTTTREKINAAVDAGDVFGAAFIATTSSWKILEGIWAANDKPMPPVGAARAHLRDLTTTPEGMEALIRELMLGSVTERTNAATTLAAWALHRLRSSP